MGKISLSNIAEELAAKAGLSRENANNFAHAFVDTVEKGLQADGVVKVKGLGTFKLQEVSDRDSVDVNTGERITIKGYRKVTFTPDTVMKEFVNRPFAHFEPTELNEGYPTDEDLVAEEPTSEDLAEETIDVKDPATEPEQPSVEQPAIEESIVEEPAVEEPAVEELATEQPAAEEPTAEEPVVIAEPVATEESAITDETASEPASEQPEAAPAVTEAPAPPKAQPKPGVLTLTPALQAKAVKDITLADTTDYTISGTMQTHKLKSGETIIQLSNKYYGDKRLWPYIVKHNRMKNFNSVAIGQAIQIPVLEAR